MIKCGDDCIACCDYCFYAYHEYYQDDCGEIHKGEPTGCRKHLDKKHQEIAKSCGYCDDFYCINAVKEQK